jgi:hypothetical protein
MSGMLSQFVGPDLADVHMTVGAMVERERQKRTLSISNAKLVCHLVGRVGMAQLRASVPIRIEQTLQRRLYQGLYASCSEYT